MPNTMLRLWENHTPRKSDQLTNVGASWVIDPTGPIVKPTECINATSAPGILKIYRDFHPDCLVIHWMFPNVHVGHVLWVSQAPTHLTFAQVDTVRHIEKQLAEEWERTIRCDFIMLTPPISIFIGIWKNTPDPIICPPLNAAEIRNSCSNSFRVRPSTITPIYSMIESTNSRISILIWSSTGKKGLPITPATTARAPIRSTGSAITTSAVPSVESVPTAVKTTPSSMCVRKAPRPALVLAIFFVEAKSPRISPRARCV